MTSFAQRTINRFGRVTRSIGVLPGDRSLLVSLCMNGQISGTERAAVRSSTVLNILRFLCCANRPIRFRSNISNTGWALRNIGYYPGVTISALPARWFPWDISVSDASAPPRQRTKRHWEILYDYAPGLDLGSCDVVIPYSIHPVHLHTGGLDGVNLALPFLRQTNRTQRLLFAGSTGYSYKKNAILNRVFGKLDRWLVHHSFCKSCVGLPEASVAS